MVFKETKIKNVSELKEPLKEDVLVVRCKTINED